MESKDGAERTQPVSNSSSDSPPADGPPRDQPTMQSSVADLQAGVAALQASAGAAEPDEEPLAGELSEEEARALEEEAADLAEAEAFEAELAEAEERAAAARAAAALAASACAVREVPAPEGDSIVDFAAMWRSSNQQGAAGRTGADEPALELRQSLLPEDARLADEQEPETISVDQVLSVPEDRIGEFLKLPSDAPPESVEGVLAEEAPGSLAALMEEIGCNDAAPLSSSWLEEEPQDEPAPARPPVPLGGLAPRIPSIPPPLPKEPPKAASSPLAKLLPKPGTIKTSERSPKSKRRPRVGTGPKSGRGRHSPPRRRHDAPIPAPPPADDEQLDRDMITAIARSSIYPLGEPPIETVLAPGDRAAETTSSERGAAVPASVAAARARAAAAEKKLRLLAWAFALVVVGIGAYTVGRLTSQPSTAGNGAEPADHRMAGRAADERDQAGKDPPATAGPPAAASAASEPTAGPGAGAPSPDDTAVSMSSPGGPPVALGATAATTAGGTAATATAAAEPASTGAEPAASTEPAALAEFDKQAASAALGAAAAAAAGCRPDSSEGTVAIPVAVTFAPSGRVTTANVQGGNFAGTSTGGCIARAFKAARVPPFAGGPVTVQKTVTLR